MSDAIELAGRLREWGSIRCCAEGADMIEQQAARIAELEGTIKRQASAARAGMDAAKRVSTIQFQEASRLRAESSPDVLASERQANALLTDENERLTARIAELTQRIPVTPQQMIDFIGHHFSSMRAEEWTDTLPAKPAGDLSQVSYSLTVHDLLSAFDWAGFGPQGRRRDE